MSILRRICCALFLVPFLAAMTGCGAPVREKDAIMMWLVGSEAQAQTLLRLADKFTEETGIRVRCEAVSWGDAHSKYLTSMAGNVAPDIGTMGLTWGMEFGELGALVDLRQAFPDDVADMEETIFPGLLEATRVGERMYGIPFDMSEKIMYYRTDIVPHPPRTWEQLVYVLRQLKEQDRGMVMDWGSLDWIGYSSFLWQAGGDYYNEDKTRATLDSREAAEALEFFAKLYEIGVPRTQVPLVQGMRTGDYPLAISGNWQLISLELGAPEIRGRWSIAPLPKGPSGKRTAFIGGRILSIFAQSEMQEEAWEFIKFISQPEKQLKIYEASLETEDSYLPPNMDTWDLLPMRQEFRDVLIKQAQDTKGPPAVRSWDPSTRFVNHAIQRVILRGADAAEELKKANEELQRELERVRR